MTWGSGCAGGWCWGWVWVMGGGAARCVRSGMSPRILPPTTTIRPVPSASAVRARRTPFPRYVFGPKPKRRTELGLLLFGSLLIVALYVIAVLGQKSKIPDNIGAFLGVVLGLALLAHMANRWLAPNANAVILPLAALLNGIGYVVIARWDPGQAQGQAAWAALGVMLYVLTLLVVRYSRDLERYRYLLLLVAGIFLVAPLFFSPIYGARLWVHFGSLVVPADRVLQDPPLHLLRLLLRGEQGDALDPDGADREPPLPRPAAARPDHRGLGRRHGGHRARGRHRLRRPAVRPLHRPALGRHGAGRLPGARAWCSSGSGAYIAARYFGQVHLRVAAMAEPVADDGQAERQRLSAERRPGTAWATGGVGGTGLGFDHYAGYIPELTSDMIFAAIGTEMGLVGCVAVVMAFILLVGPASGWPRRPARTSRASWRRG